MTKDLKYMPVLRVRQEEVKVLKSFDFGDRIYPCLEIYKERERETSKKSFEDFHVDLIKNINAKKVFIDIPVHMKQSKSMKKHVLTFLRSISANRKLRTDYILKLKSLSDKIIPVISSYFNRTNEPGSIRLQETDLRPIFASLAFRTFPDTFKNDFSQIQLVATKKDYVIIDLGDLMPNIEDEDDVFLEILEKLQDFNKCPVIILRSAINKITNVSLQHGKEIPSIDNSLVDLYQDYAGTAFGDYAGIKKDEVTEGGRISPGFIYYDATKNSFFGFKGRVNELGDFETIIVPDVLSSDATNRMKLAGIDYLNSNNMGWQTVLSISRRSESGKSMAKFKNISMNHYLHCIKMRITEGEFD